MTETPADEYRQAAAELRDVAPMIDGPLAGLADPVADWLDQAAKHHDATVIGAASVWQRPDEAAYRDAFVTKQTDRAALAVARQILGTTTRQPETEAPAVDRATVADALADADGWEWAPGFDKTRSPSYQGYLRQADAVLAVLAAEAQQPAPAVADPFSYEERERTGRNGGLTEASRSYRLEHRHREESTWRPNTPGIGANWSWQSREKADQRLAEARTRWPDFEHRLIETTTTVTEQPAPAVTEEPTLCGNTQGLGTTNPYRPCARPAGHPEAYCKDATGDHLFLPATHATEEPK